MPTLPPHERQHHEIYAGAENLPNQDLRGTYVIDIPLIAIPAINGELTLEAQKGTELDEKTYPRPRFSLHNLKDLRGSLFLKLTIMFRTFNVNLRKKSSEEKNND